MKPLVCMTLLALATGPVALNATALRPSLNLFAPSYASICD